MSSSFTFTAPSAGLKDNDLLKWLEKKLGDSSDVTWTGRSTAAFLSREMIEELMTCFQRIDTQIKLRLLAAIPYITPRQQANWKEQLNSLISLAARDPDDWVVAMAEFCTEFPETGRLNLDTVPGSHFTKTLEELQKIMRKHADKGDLKLLPSTSRIMCNSAIKQQYGDVKPEIENHFTLKHKPKSFQLKLDVLKQATEGPSHTSKMRTGALHSLPVCRIRSTARKPVCNAPMAPLNSNILKLSSGFTNEPRKFQSAALKREGGVKLLDINEIPQSLKKRRVEMKAEEKKKKAEEKQEAKRREKEEKEAKAEEAKKQKAQEKADAARLKADQLAAAKEAKKTKKLVGRTSSITSQTSTSESRTESDEEKALALSAIQSMLRESPANDSSGALTPDSPCTSGTSHDVFQTSTSDLHQNLQSSPLISPASSASPMQSPSHTTSGLFTAYGQSSQVKKTQNVRLLLPPQGQQFVPQQQQSQPSQQRFEVQQQFVQQQQRAVPLLNPQQEFRLTHMSPPGVSQQQQQQQRFIQPATSVQNQVVYQSHEPRIQIQASQPQQQLHSGLFDNVQARFMQQQPPQQRQNSQQLIVQQPIMQNTQMNQQYQPQQQNQMPQFVSAPNTEIRAQIDEVLRFANRLDDNGRRVVSDFISGHRVNPRPDLGHVITLKLSDTSVVDEENGHMKVETFFQMDFATNTWKRLRKVRAMTQDELQDFLAQEESLQQQQMLQHQTNQQQQMMLNFTSTPQAPF